MRSWIFRNLAPGTELTHHEGVQPGDEVVIYGYRNEVSLDVRRVVRITRERCDCGVMLHLDRPLHSGSTRISFNWTRPPARRQ